MSHTARQKTKLLHRVHRIRGQLDAIERALETEAPCDQVLHVISACRGALNGLLGEVVEEHIRDHLVEPLREQQPQASVAAEQLVDVFRGYFK